MRAQRATRARVPAQNPATVEVKPRARKRASDSARPVLVFPSQAKASQSVPPVVSPEFDIGSDPVSNKQSHVEEAASSGLNAAQERPAPARQIGSEPTRRGWRIAHSLSALAWESGKEQSVRTCQISAELARRGWYIAHALFALAWKNGKAQLSRVRENGSKLLSSTWRNAGLLSSSAWRNFRTQQIARSTGKRLQVAATISLGEKRFVAVIKVDGREFLVGGGSSSVALLAQLDGMESKESFDRLLTEKMAVPGVPVAKKRPAKRTRKRIAKSTAEQAVEQA